MTPRRTSTIHPAGIMVLTPAGKMSRYFYDVDFVPRDLRLGLVEASAEKIGSPTDQVLLYCCHVRSARPGKYTANVLMFVRAGGVLTIVVLGRHDVVSDALSAAEARSRLARRQQTAAPLGRRRRRPRRGDESMMFAEIALFPRKHRPPPGRWTCCSSSC